MRKQVSDLLHYSAAYLRVTRVDTDRTHRETFAYFIPWGTGGGKGKDFITLSFSTWLAAFIARSHCTALPVSHLLRRAFACLSHHMHLHICLCHRLLIEPSVVLNKSARVGTRV